MVQQRLGVVISQKREASESGRLVEREKIYKRLSGAEVFVRRRPLN